MYKKERVVVGIKKRKNDSAATSKELAKAFLKMEDRFVAKSILRYLSKKFNHIQVQ